MHRFLLGMMLCAINPVQIPFWFGWSTVLFSKNILQTEKIQYNLYILGIGTGTIIGHALFILGGSWVVSKISNSTDYINWVIGGFFSITAIVQLIKIIRHKGVEEKISKIEDELEAEVDKNA